MRLVAALLLAAAAWAPRVQPAHAATQRRYEVAAIGDSLTDDRSHGAGYMSQLQARCPESRFDNYGVGGQLVRRMRQRFERDVFGEPPERSYSHVIVFGGVNDILSNETDGRTVTQISDDLRAMYELARGRGARVVAITLSPWRDFKKHNPVRARMTSELNRWIRQQHKRGAVDHVIDASSLLACGEAGRLCEDYRPPFRDGLHFGAKGHQRLSDAMLGIFSDCL